MKRVGACSLARVALACAVRAVASAEKLIVMISGREKQMYLPIELARDLGYFSAQGLDVELRGVTGLGVSANFIAQYIAETHGVTASEITPLPVGSGATFVAAMLRCRDASTRASQPSRRSQASSRWASATSSSTCARRKHPKKRSPASYTNEFVRAAH